VVAATSKFLLKGGVLLLLPLMIYSDNPNNHAGIQASYGITDNVHQLNIMTAGQELAISPYVFLAGFLEFDYSGDISIISFDANNLVVANDIRIKKGILFPRVGNKTAIYAELYTFYAPAYEQYRFADISVGNDLNLYLDNFLFSNQTKIRYKHYPLDSLTDYLEPSMKLELAIPLPYFVFTPGIGCGFRRYGEECISLYTAVSNLYLPLTLDFSMACEFRFSHVSQPQSYYIIPPTYADEPFFEEENVKESAELSISANRMAAKKRVFVEATLTLFNKVFYEVENLSRTDKGLRTSVQFRKFLNDNLGMHINLYSHINTSTIDDFDYMKNGVEFTLELIF